MADLGIQHSGSLAKAPWSETVTSDSVRAAWAFFDVCEEETETLISSSQTNGCKWQDGNGGLIPRGSARDGGQCQGALYVVLEYCSL